VRRAEELPGGLLGGALRTQAAGPPDEDEEQRLERAFGRLEPDPLFRRRLRTSVLNYHVAMREGHLHRRPRPPRRMGAIGRSVLYASVVLAMGVSAVGAASQGSLPGEPLYGVKMRLEQIRMQIAPPSVRDDLATLALAERTRELQHLVESGDWSSTVAAAERVAAAEATLLAMEPDASQAVAASHAHDVLEAVLSDAPPAARTGLERALHANGAKATAPKGPAQPSRGAADEATQKPHPTPQAHPSTPPNRGGGNGGKPPENAKHGNAHD
jgi:hypothetical protein